MLMDRLGLSQRRACRIVGQHRTTQRHQPAEAVGDSALRAELRAFAKAHPRWGTAGRTPAFAGRAIIG